MAHSDAAPGRPAPLMYKVPSGVGARDIPVLGDGEGVVMQPFVATAPRINAAAVIIGIDPARADPRQPHRIRLEIVELGRAPGSSLRAAEATVTVENNNTDITAVFPTPVDVQVGQLYVLRMTNLSSDVIGVYVNKRNGPEQLVPYAQDVCISGAVGPFTRTARIVSGYISALT